jgi:tetratricopeptide (TPR) repeat protein
VLKTECLFSEQDWPLASAAAVIRETLGLGEREPGRVLFEKLQPLLANAPKYAARQHTFLEEFLRSPDALWSSYEGGRRELVRRAASGLGVLISRLAAERPVVFVIENAHWLDETSIDVVQELTNARAAVPILVLFVGHPTTVSEQRIPDMATIEVQELPDPLLKRLILDRLGPAESMQAITDQILARAQGNPFFAGEIIDSLIEQHILVRDTATGDNDSAQYRQARPGSISLPTTMEGIARSRIDALSQDQRTVLRTASAVGASFSLATLNKLVDEPVNTSVDSLVARDMLAAIPSESDGSPAYRFCQPMVREVAYAGLSIPDQRRIHQEMADQLIARTTEGETVPKVRIAWHLDRSGDSEMAGRYYLEAGKESLLIHSDREALKLYDRAIPRLREDSLERLDALIRREWVLRELGRYKEQEEDLSEMERIAQVLGEDTLAAHAKTRQALLKYDLCDFREAARKLNQSLALSIRSKDATQQIEALRLLAYVAVEEGHLTRALDCCNRALVIVPEEMSDVGLYLRGRSLGIKGFVLINMGHLDQAAIPLADALAMFRRLRARRQESQTLSNLALLAQARGEFMLAIEFLESAIRIDTEVYDVTARGQKLAVLAAIHTDLGDIETAHTNIRDARSICQQNREHFGEIDANLGLARLMILDGDPALATEILKNTAQGDMVVRSRRRLVQHHQLTAKALLETEFPTLARDMAEEATRIALGAGMDGEAIYSGVLLARILAELGLYNKSLTALNDARTLLAKLGKVHNTEEIWWLMAVSYQHIGDSHSANSALQKARKEVDRRISQIGEHKFLTCYKNHPIVRAVQSGLEEVDNPVYP